MLHNVPKPTMASSLPSPPTTTEYSVGPLRSIRVPIQGDQKVALESMIIAKMVLESQAWKSAEACHRLGNDLYRANNGFAEGSVAARLTNLLRLVRAFDFSPLQLEFRAVLEDSLLASAPFTFLAAGQKIDQSTLNEFRSVDQINLAELETGALAHHFGGSASMRETTLHFVDSIYPLLSKDLKELQSSRDSAQVTPGMLYYTAFTAELQQAIYNQLFLACSPDAAKACVRTFRGTAAQIAHALVSSIEVSLAIKAEADGLSLSDITLQIGALVRSRRISSQYAAKDMDHVLAQLVSCIDRINCCGPNYQHKLAVVKHGQQAVTSLVKIAEKLPAPNTEGSAIFPQARMGLMIHDGEHELPITVIFDGAHGQLVVHPLDLGLQDNTGGFLPMGQLDSDFLPGACPIVVNSDGSFTCGVGMSGLYATLPNYHPDQTSSLRKIQSFFQAQLLQIWTDFPEIMNLSNLRMGIFWIADRNGNLQVAVPRTLVEENLMLFTQYKRDDTYLKGSDGTVALFLLREVKEPVELKKVPTPCAPALPHFAHFTDIVRVLERMGARVTTGRGSHTGLEYNGHKYTLCRTIRSAEGKVVDRILIQIIKYLKISPNDFIAAYNRND